MAEYPQNLKYPKEHEWARKEGKSVVVGITSYAQEELDGVYVELPKVGSTITVGTPFGVIESTKAVSELFAPISGKVVAVTSWARPSAGRGFPAAAQTVIDGECQADHR